VPAVRACFGRGMRQAVELKKRSHEKVARLKHSIRNCLYASPDGFFDEIA